jgi:hypothetical protein
VPGKAQSGSGARGRWRTWLRGPADDVGSDESEEGAAPAAPGDEGTRIPQTSLDEVLREVAERRDPGCGEDAEGGPPGR